MISPELASIMKMVKQEINQHFSEIYNASSGNPYEKTSEAMRYMALLGNGGKRIRPTLTYLANCLFDGDGKSYLPLAAGVENIHTYTLIIDDIQDGDAMRRGEETCHTKYGVNTAILTGSRLYERGTEPFHVYDPVITEMVRDLLDKLHQGQAADLEAEKWTPSQKNEEAWQFIAAGKTASLLQLALLGGALSAGITQKDDLEPLLAYGYYLGLVFQAKDDILGALGDSEETGKAVGADDALNKFTFLSLHDGNIQKAQEQMMFLADSGISALQAYQPQKTTLLAEVMHFAANRQK